MDGEQEFYSIGDLARRTGMPVKTIRFYSDTGLLPPAGRSHAGYRRYDLDALARLDLVRTLRELGLGLADIRTVLDRERSIAEVAALHAEAIGAQINVLRLRRAVLRAVAKRGSDPKEINLMSKLAQLSAVERKRIIENFHDETFDGLDIHPDFAAKFRGVVPELPDDPTADQAEAWIELAELVADPGFRARVRRMAQVHNDTRKSGEHQAAYEGCARAGAQLGERSVAAVEAGVDPAGPEGQAIVTELVALFLEGHGGQDTPEFRAWLACQIEEGSDQRVDRYWRLISRINGWPPRESRHDHWDWMLAALRT
ncbi:MerR family transcriptional regulator [Longispora albida]|uniref:MerR family transcriptional regulator n=1 Tax=Longispora albida TaxID=203523 RepID=UPI000368843E|nr:MerR family transcriptional regulator [Longispora albida]